MDRATGATPDFSLETDPFINAVGRLQEGVQEYYKGCEMYARKPRDKFFRPIEEGMGTQMGEFINALCAMEPGSEAEQIGNAGTALILESAEGRTKELNKLTDTELLKPLKNNSILLDTSQWDYLDQDEFKKKIIEDRAQIFNTRMSEDTTEFIMFIAQTKLGRRLELVRDIKLHTLEVSKDVGKIALGTALGMLAAKAISRK